MATTDFVKVCDNGWFLISILNSTLATVWGVFIWYIRQLGAASTPFSGECHYMLLADEFITFCRFKIFGNGWDRTRLQPVATNPKKLKY